MPTIPQKTRILLLSLLAILVLFLSIPPIIVYRGKYRIYTQVENVKQTEYAIVFGASVFPDQRPSAVLKHRLDVAIQLYNEDKVGRILVTGYKREESYDEPQTMYNYLIENGIPEEDILVDNKGKRTYNSCYRAYNEFAIDKAILISQGYHLPRAIFICSNLGVNSAGYSATRGKYDKSKWFEIREVAALYWSVLDVYIIKPVP